MTAFWRCAGAASPTKQTLTMSSGSRGAAGAVAVLAHGGVLVVQPRYPEADLDQLLRDARPQGSTSGVLRGKDNACHANAAVLWMDGAVTAIGTGYTLSDVFARNPVRPAAAAPSPPSPRSAVPRRCSLRSRRP